MEEDNEKWRGFRFLHFIWTDKITMVDHDKLCTYNAIPKATTKHTHTERQEDKWKAERTNGKQKLNSRLKN